MSESALRKAEKKGYNFTCHEKNKGKAGVAVWMCKCPNFVNIKVSAYGLGTSQESAFEECQKFVKSKEVNKAAWPKMKETPKDTNK